MKERKNPIVASQYQASLSQRKLFGVLVSFVSRTLFAITFLFFCVVFQLIFFFVIFSFDSAVNTRRADP